VVPVLILLPKTENTLGEISMALLWVILWLPVFYKVFNLGVARSLMVFRRPLGILMGMLVFVHFVQYFFKKKALSMVNPEFWIDEHGITYLAVGFGGLLAAFLLTITSNDYAMRRLKKNWKTLHKIVYVLIVLGVLHIIIYNTGKHLKHPERPFSFVRLYIVTLLPLGLYFIGKILAWRKVSWPLVI
jgi:sulfoxide reductase heme-binding subunit YedZ